jgi:hypothetical protein
LGVIFRCNRGFECFVVFNVFQDLNDRFGAQPVAQRVAPGPPLPGFSSWTGALLGIAPIGCDLPPSRHLAVGSLALRTTFGVAAEAI